MPKTILLVLFMMFNLNVNAQLLVEDGNCYLYGEQRICNPKTIEDMLSYNLNALHWYHKSEKSAKQSTNFGISALVGLTASVLLIKHSTSKGEDPLPGPLFLGLGIGLLSCVLGTIGIIERAKHFSESKKAIDIYNGTAFGDLNTNYSKTLSFGIVKNGVGIELNF